MLNRIHKISNYRFLSESYVTLQQVSGFFTRSCLAAKLPKLPVPKLSDTVAKYLQTVKPFLSETEYTETKHVIKDFQYNWGKKMQAVLEDRAVTLDNWLDEWWLNTAYLEARKTLLVYSSPGVFLPAQKFNSPDDQYRFIAKLLLGTLEYKGLIDNDKLPREKMGKHPLDMGQYKMVLGTSRIPLPVRDKLSFNGDSRHIIVLHKNNIFRMDLWGSDNVMLNEKQIIDQLRHIQEQSTEINKDGIGYLTSEHRDNWAKAYESLLKDKTNEKHLKDIEKSLIAVCMDNPLNVWKLPNDDARRTFVGEQALHGGGPEINGGNRWYDKTIQIIVGADGLAGVSYEHTPADGGPVAVLVDYLIDYVADKKGGGLPASKSPIPPQFLKFNVSLEVAAAIRDAKVHLNRLVANVDLNCFKYAKYGNTFIKSFRLSPDSYIQMAMQYAFYRLYKLPGATYESAATRMYKAGRTEVIRSSSLESVMFCKAMLNLNISSQDKVKALHRAIIAHKKYAVEALQGYGVDRHLLGLKLAAIESGVQLHKLYSDPSFTRSAHMRMSTSQVKFKSDVFMCYGPRVDDGYAMCYNPRAKNINFALAAFEKHIDTSSAKYREAMELSLQEMHDLLLEDKKKKDKHEHKPVL